MTFPTVPGILGPDYAYVAPNFNRDVRASSNPMVEAGNIYTQGTTAPTAPFEGQYWADTSSGSSVIKTYQDGVWVDVKNTFAQRKVGASVAITSVANPAAAQDLVTISGLNIGTGAGILIYGQAYMTSSVAAANKVLTVGLKLNTTVISEASGAVGDASPGLGVVAANNTTSVWASWLWYIPRRDVNYPTNGKVGWAKRCGSEVDGAYSSMVTLGATAGLLTATITSVVIRVRAAPGTNCIVLVGPVYVYELDE